MKIINFEKKQSEDREKSIEHAIKYLKKSTQFILVFSEDNLDTVCHYHDSVSVLQSIAMLDIVKHAYLSLASHNCDPDDGEQEVGFK